MSNTPEPAPIPQPTRPSSWSQVIAFVTHAFEDGDVKAALLVDMAARNAEGIKKYGTPLTAGNGRKSMVDAYQEALDMSVYLRTELEERGLDPLAPKGIFTVQAPEDALLLMLYGGAVQSALMLKALIMGSPIVKEMLAGVTS